MQEKPNSVYLAIDLKSFYASVECVDRGLDPLTTNLVVADQSRTDKTICLAVSPALKSFGVPGRPRLFEVIQKVLEVNWQRRKVNSGRKLEGESCFLNELSNNPSLAVSYIVAPPQMARYMEVSTKIFEIYLKYVSSDDIHVYSIDEVFIDATPYLEYYNMQAREFAEMLIKEVLKATGITATAGIGTNLYLCKVAMDIVAKHVQPDQHGVRIACLSEMSYRRLLWGHEPITDFWRVGPGYARKLAQYGMFTMGDVARCSIGKDYERRNQKLLYKLFGVNAELLIDHAWGWEPCTMKDIKAYKPSAKSLGSGQVLHCPYTCEQAKVVTREMVDNLILDLVEKGLVASQLVLTIGYDRESLTNPEIKAKYHGPIKTDHYGRSVPAHSHGSTNFGCKTSSAKLISEAAMKLYDRIVNPDLLVRRLTISANGVVSRETAQAEQKFEQIDLFTDYAAEEKKQADLDREMQMQLAMVRMRQKYGKNALLKGTNFLKEATGRDRNGQIGGHKA